MKKKVWIVILMVLLLVQFMQPPKYNGSAETATDITHVVKVPDSVMHLLKTACYDCHSNHTNYPWYSRITPVNWWLNHHIKEGRRELNFSTIANGSFRRKARKMKETAELVKNHEMPIHSYLWIHSEARLNEAQRSILTDWAKAAQTQILQDSVQTRDH